MKKFRQIKIVSEGIPARTRVVDAETGEDVGYVTRVHIHPIDARVPSFTRVDVTFVKVDFDVKGVAVRKGLIARVWDAIWREE